VKKAKALFLYTGNSCRSQMAEGWARALKGDFLEPYSAGIEVHGLNPHAVRVMREAGVDNSGGGKGAHGGAVHLPEQDGLETAPEEGNAAALLAHGGHYAFTE
jgi:protein-tyrosine-phosphatase